MVARHLRRHAKWGRPLMRLALRHRRLVVVALHLVMVVVANRVALWLRFDGVVPPAVGLVVQRFLPLLLLVRAATFVPFRLYEGLWRYTSVKDVRNIVLAVASSSCLFYLVVRWAFGYSQYPRSIYIIDSLLLVLFMAGLRSVRRLVRELGNEVAGRRVLVYGAGDAGEMIVRQMRRHPSYGGEPIGFIDDDRGKVGQRIHGLRVFGSRRDLATVIEQNRPDEVLIAMPSIPAATMRDIVSALGPYKIAIKTLPNLRDILDGAVSLEHIRTVAIEDLLPRAPIELDSARVSSLISGRRVLVTGAGGSIGSELCRQILSFGPRSLVLFERYENSLFAIDNDLRQRRPLADIHSVIGDMCDRRRVDAVFAQHKPEIVFHAAAHKHVPLMELNPCEAVKNNVGGAWTLTRAAVRHGVSRFVMISTDKAVNPTSVMGATKRVAELIVQATANGGHANGTKFSVVRFGNVLGSNGSVVPRFVGQIQAGGPVTVTHPDMRRFFMLIPEAVQLVLQAASIGDAGEVLVLDMGEQIKVLDVARNLIRLSGYLPEEDIPIVFTGLRPGEKLYEELVGRHEEAEPSGIEKVTRIRRASVSGREIVERHVLQLVRLARRGDATAVRDSLRQLVPTYDAPLACTGGGVSGSRGAGAVQPTLLAASHGQPQY
jgi:FlaA1/EpsC-like NDP-sugar epimerase